METVNQFDWPEVAAIAGVIIVLLMTLITALLTILLRRSGKEGNGDGIIVQVKAIKSSIETKINSLKTKIDQETKDRKEDFDFVKLCVTEGRVEWREDINVLHQKLDTGLGKVVEDFHLMCTTSQTKCAALQKVAINGTKEKLAITCRTVEEMGKERQRKWEAQEVLNREFVSKINP